MVNVFVALLSVLLPLVHLSLSRRAKTRRRVIYLLLLYALVFDVGFVGLIFGFIPHVFFADQAAEGIGWAPGSPFQFEVGFHDGAWGLLGFLCIWIGGLFWYNQVQIGPSRELSDLEKFPLEPLEGDANCFAFVGTIPCVATGHRGYSVRVLPFHPDINVPGELNLVAWEE